MEDKHVIKRKFSNNTMCLLAVFFTLLTACLLRLLMISFLDSLFNAQIKTWLFISELVLIAGIVAAIAFAFTTKVPGYNDISVKILCGSILIQTIITSIIDLVYFESIYHILSIILAWLTLGACGIIFALKCSSNYKQWFAALIGLLSICSALLFAVQYRAYPWFIVSSVIASIAYCLFGAYALLSSKNKEVNNVE